MLATFLVLLSGIVNLTRETRIKYAIITLLITILPFQSYGYGKNKALHIEQGSNFKYVVNKITGIEVSHKIDLRYLGVAGESLFLYNAFNKQILIFERRSVNPLILQSLYDVSKNDKSQ